MTTKRTTKTKPAISKKGHEEMGTESKNEIVPAPQILPATALSNIDNFLEATAAESAKFLKFTKGEFLIGIDEEEVEAGTKMVVNVAGITCGHVKWEDKVPVDESMTPIIEGMFTPREELGDLDKALWDVDDDGNSKDPWARTTKMPMRDPVTGDEFVYSTSSRGGIGAVGRMVSAIRKGQRAGQTGLPTIRLDVDSYKHKTYGKVFVPSFPVIGFKSEVELMGGEPDFDAELNDEVPF